VLREDAKEKNKVASCKHRNDDYTWMIDEKNSELTNEGLSSAFGS